MVTATRAPDWGRLESLLESEPLAWLVELARAHPGRVALVGGAIRDTMLGRELDDLDLIVETGFDAFVLSLEQRLGRRLSAIGDRFQQTRRFRRAGVQVDVAEAQGRIEEDLARRDFTVNAMAVVVPTVAKFPEALVDLFDGVRDLSAARLRQTGPEVIAADPLRVLRAARYASALDFTVGAATGEALRVQAPRLGEMAAERICGEWESILLHDRWVQGILLATEIGATRATLGDLPAHLAIDAWAASERGGEQGAEPFSGRLGALVLDLARAAPLADVAQTLHRGRWPARRVRRAVATAGWARQLAAIGADPVGWALSSAPAAADAGRLAEWIARVEGSQPPRQATQLRTYAARAGEAPWVRGADLLSLGMASGEAVGEVLETLRRGQLRRRWDGRDAAIDWARAHVEGKTR